MDFSAALVITNILLAIASIFIMSSAFYIILLFASNRMLKKERLNWPFLKYDHPPISLLVPAFNEEKDIREAVKSLLKQRYEKFEIIVINDGSTDKTLEYLMQSYQFEKIEVNKDQFKLCKSQIKAIYKCVNLPLYIIDKENSKKADSLNAGLDFSNYDYVCSVDADSILEPTAFSRVMQEFIINPEMIACGAAIRVINGTEINNGVIRHINLPKTYLEMCQLIEYTQTFFMGRIGWQYFDATMIISGAFGLFKKSAILEVNGFDKNSVGEDMDLVVRLHKHFSLNKINYKIGFVPDPLCWTEVPSNFSTLANQRNRWQRGLLSSIFNKRPILFNTKKSNFSRLAIPYYVVTEVIGPIIEILSYILITAGIILGFLNWKIVLLFTIISILFSVVMSLAVFIHEEKLFTKKINIGQTLQLILGAVLMNIGYRQFIVWQRFKGFIDFCLHKDDWGKMDRSGFFIKKRKKNKN